MTERVMCHVGTTEIGKLSTETGKHPQSQGPRSESAADPRDAKPSRMQKRSAGREVCGVDGRSEFRDLIGRSKTNET